MTHSSEMKINLFYFYSRFTFYATGMDEMKKVRKALFMFVDLFGLERFEYETLVRYFVV